MPVTEELTCEIRYKLGVTKLSELEAYARAWMALIERHGGTHHGYYMPRPAPDDAGFSFAQVGTPGPTDEAVALFSFPDEESYHLPQLAIRDPEAGLWPAAKSNNGAADAAAKLDNFRNVRREFRLPPASSLPSFVI